MVRSGCQVFCRLRSVSSMIALTVLVVLGAATDQAMAQTSEQLAPLVVGNDRGGLLRTRIYEIRALRETGQAVRIEGRICYSTCTMYLGLPQTCVSPQTMFGFHGPSSYGIPLESEVFDHASKLIKDHYPKPLQQWYMDEARHQIWGVQRVTGAEIIRLGATPCQ